MPSLINNLAKAGKICAQLHKVFEDKAVIQSLIKLLLKYQPSQVTLYEVERCRYTLEHVSVLNPYLELEIGKDVCVFLPSNLPLYSTLLFVIMPGIISGTVTLRPNTALLDQGVIDQLFSILAIPKLLPNVKIFSGSRDKFREDHLSQADLIVFTGRNETRDEIKKCMKPNSYLINNGSGHNPIVVGEDADIELATGEVLYARFFNSGQDCAGPDAVFVHDKLVPQFLMKIREKISLVCGSVENEDHEQFSTHNQPSSHHIEMAKFHRTDELLRLQSVIDDNKDEIVIGGCVDFQRKTVSPTIIYDHLDSAVAKGSINFTEMFGPIMFLYGYGDDAELKAYFENSRYTQNKMYVSLFGSSPYLLSKNDEVLLQSKGSAKGGVGILLHNKIIHDIHVDNGTVAYGGYSKGGSSILHKPMNRTKISSVALPILLPKVMYQLFVKEIPLLELISRSSSSPDSSVDRVIKMHDEGGKMIVSKPSHAAPSKSKILKQKIATEILAMFRSTFEFNLNFGFAFGSVTEERYSLEESGLSTYVCTNQLDGQQYTRFTTQMEEFHRSYRCAFDHDHNHEYPAQLITSSELRRMTNHLHYQLYGLNYNPWRDEEEPLNCSFLTQFKCHHAYTHYVTFIVSVLAEKPKFALVTRDKSFFHEMVSAAKEVAQLIKTEMLEHVRSSPLLPEVLNYRYPGSSKEEIVAKLEGLTCCEILHHVEWIPPQLHVDDQPGTYIIALKKAQF